LLDKDKDDAEQKAAKFTTLYFGRAHIFVVDRNVMVAKINFNIELEKALKSGAIWSEELRRKAVMLRDACKEALNVEEIFSKKQK